MGIWGQAFRIECFELMVESCGFRIEIRRMSLGFRNDTPHIRCLPLGNDGAPDLKPGSFTGGYLCGNFRGFGHVPGTNS